MLTARNIHLLLLGAILGTATAYLYTTIRAESRRAVLAAEAQPAGHPDVTEADLHAMFEEALAAAPDDPELRTRYATFLFDSRRFGEAADQFQRVLTVFGNDAEIRTYMATALYANGDREEAMAEFVNALESDPTQILALHNLALGHLDLNGDVDAATRALEEIRRIDPAYEGLDSLRQRIEAARGSGNP